MKKIHDTTKKLILWSTIPLVILLVIITAVGFIFLGKIQSFEPLTFKKGS